MIVTVIADVLGEENNGTTTACMNLVRHLKSQGDEVRIVCCDQEKKGIDGYYVVPVYKFGPIINKMIEKNNVVLAKPNKKIIYDAIKDCDCVHIMMPFSLGRESVKIAKKLGKPVTAGFHVQAENFTTHIKMMKSRLVNHLTYKHFYHCLYKKVDAIHYPTEFIKNIFESHINKKTNGYVISNGVNSCFKREKVSKPEFFEKNFIILFTGRLSEEKSHKILIKAVSKSKYSKNILLLFAGQGPYEKYLKKYAKKKNVSCISKFYDRSDLVTVINYSDLYCHPAEVEIEAIACLEAISCGKVPVIANSKKCATKSFAIDEKNLFKTNDAIDLAKKIDYWIENPEDRIIREQEYLNYSKIFNQEECMKQMRNMMLDCINKKNEK